MCAPGQPQLPGTAGEALAALEGAYAFLAAADVASMPAAEQGDLLRALERAGSRHSAARATVLAAFTAQESYVGDGQQSPKSWLVWQTQVTPGAAATATGWMRRLAAHPAVGRALAAGDVTTSWAEKICQWTDMLPEGHRPDGDEILLAAAAGGAGLADLAGLAEEMHRRSCPPDGDDDDGGFSDRRVRLDRTFGNRGSLDGDLTPACRAALAAVLESLGGRAGPEDVRTQDQRYHDALEEAARRLIAAGMLPDRAGQPTQVQLLIPLGQLRDLPGGADAEAAWAAQAAADGRPGWLLDRSSAEAYACDAKITPVVTGHVDPAALAQLTTAYLASLHRPGSPPPRTDHLAPVDGVPGPGAGQPRCRDRDRWPPGAAWPPAGPGTIGALPSRTLRRLQNTLLAQAADVLSGPAGLAAYLRTRLLAPEFVPAVSRALDVGVETNTIPAYLRRAVILRDRHCAFPGCRQRPAACQVHHILARAKGGATALVNLLLLCPFHHLIAVHRWGWTIQLHADGTTTATSPDRQKTLRSHGPPTPILA